MYLYILLFLKYIFAHACFKFIRFLSTFFMHFIFVIYIYRHISDRAIFIFLVNIIQIFIET